MSEQVLERFHRALIEEIQTQRPEYLTSPFTVAEIYQNLVPYGSHRDRIGVEMNGDYEDALIRLLAGEGGYLILDSEPALRDLRAELETPNPNTGLYREFAAVDVRLNRAYLDLSASALDELPDLAAELEVEDPVTMSDLAPGEGTAMANDLGIVPPGVDIFAVAGTEPEPELDEEPDGPPSTDPAYDASGLTSSADDGTSHGRPPLAPEFVDVPSEAKDPSGSRAAARHTAPDGACRWCSELLPDRSPMNFCAFCGTDLKLVPCTACGGEIEPGWKYCVSCGAEADTPEVGG